MPLPPALLARLAKRGIIQEQPQAPPPKPEEVEEVFAEDYDDPAKPEPEEPTEAEEPESAPVTEDPTDSGVEEDAPYVYEVLACPNRGNPYHVCVKYCKKRWGLKQFTAEPKMVSRRDRMLRKYPLPEGWKEVADPDTGRYYYWSMQTDQVSWLSPAHPHAIISMSADFLAGKTSGGLSDLEDEMEEGEDFNIMDDDDKLEGDSDLSDSMSDSDSEDERRRERARAQRERDAERRGARSRGSFRGREEKRGKRRRDDLDPMDPASYSDIPRGGWTDGLDTRGSAKTGVDVTASGPLFQQRPYPSPGDILRANQQLKKPPPME